MSGSLYQGYVPDGVTGPLTLDQLVQTYGVGTAYSWQIVQAGAAPAAPITAVPGPAGPSVIAAKGDLAVGNTVGAPTRLPAGADGGILVLDSTQPTGVRWSADLLTLEGFVAPTLFPYSAAQKAQTLGAFFQWL
jgi:hypothetical protein